MVIYKGINHPHMCDVMGHMTTRHYVAMFDDGSYHFLYELFGWSTENLTMNQTGWADVRHVIEYMAEVSSGDLLEISAKLIKIGNKSITTFYEMRNVSKNEIAATQESTTVYFDLKARAAIPITEKMKKSAKIHLAGK